MGLKYLYHAPLRAAEHIMSITVLWPEMRRGRDIMVEIGYNRQNAVEYARHWALGRNPRYYNFSGLGGDCANFASQCIHSGVGVMNYKPLFGWYYLSAEDRSPSWTGGRYLYNFLTGNKEAGPYGTETDISRIEPGDIIQIAIYQPEYHHTLVVLETGEIPTPDTILIAAHSYDSIDRQLSTYDYRQIRFLHIEGARK